MKRQGWIGWVVYHAIYSPSNTLNTGIRCSSLFCLGLEGQQDSTADSFAPSTMALAFFNMHEVGPWNGRARLSRPFGKAVSVIPSIKLIKAKSEKSRRNVCTYMDGGSYTLDPLTSSKMISERKAVVDLWPFAWRMRGKGWLIKALDGKTAAFTVSQNLRCISDDISYLYIPSLQSQAWSPVTLGQECNDHDGVAVTFLWYFRMSDLMTTLPSKLGQGSI